MLAKFMAIPHHTYLIMKMPALNRILSILEDIIVSYKCGSVRTMCGSRTGGWSLPCVMSD
jgi:hypothetical protein